MSEVSPDNVKIENSEIKRNNALVIPLISIFCLMVIMVVYTSQNVRRVTVNNIHEVGYDKISSVSAKIENYLEARIRIMQNRSCINETSEADIT